MTIFLPTSERDRLNGRRIGTPRREGEGRRGDDTCSDHTSSREGAMAFPTPLVVSTTFDVQGRRVREYKGVVRGITVRAPTISQGILGGLKSIIGGRSGLTPRCASRRGRPPTT